MVIQKERSALTGVLWAVGAALVIGVVVVIVNCIDILLSHRLSYSKFEWSGIHGVAVALLHHGLAYGWFRVQDWSALSFGLEWLALTTGAYYLIGRRFSVAAARRKYVLGFALGFLVASFVVVQIVGMVLFVAAVLKLGFV
jgi:hypothetical protein